MGHPGYQKLREDKREFRSETELHLIPWEQQGFYPPYPSHPRPQDGRKSQKRSQQQLKGGLYQIIKRDEWDG